MVNEKKVDVSGINNQRFNPFGATDEELIANALDYVGLVNNETSINGLSAVALCQSFFEKRQQYKMTSKKQGVTNQILSFNHANKGIQYIKNISSENKELCI